MKLYRRVEKKYVGHVKRNKVYAHLNIFLSNFSCYDNSNKHCPIFKLATTRKVCNWITSRCFKRYMQSTIIL